MVARFRSWIRRSGDRQEEGAGVGWSRKVQGWHSRERASQRRRPLKVEGFDQVVARFSSLQEVAQELDQEARDLIRCC